MSPCGILAYVAGVSVGFQSRERPKNEIFDDFAAREMGASEKNGAGEEGERNYRAKNETNKCNRDV